jgi:hypothetical protein
MRRQHCRSQAFIMATWKPCDAEDDYLVALARESEAEAISSIGSPAISGRSGGY